MEYFSENISVAVRIRPLFSYDNPSKIAWDPASYSCLRSVCDEKKFEFDKVYGMNSSTQRIFDEMCEQPIWKAMDGLNCSIVCYGQTGSGKTYTMCGKKKSPGIIPLTIQAIFSYIEDTPSKEFLMRCSYCEIYNECINDLLNPLNVNLPIMDDKNVIGMQRGPIILGLTEEVCKTSDQIFAILKVGDAHKKVPSTNFNQKSNRSHCVFRILIESKDRNENNYITIGVITLFDLAGSGNEKQSVENPRFQEAKFINKSLLALNTVILKLSEDKNTVYIPLGESKLTKILGPALLGNAKLVIIITLNPTADVYQESLNSLLFGKRSRSILQSVKKYSGVGETSYLWKYKSEMMILKEKLEEISGINSLQSSLEAEEEEKASIELQLENLQNAILVSEIIRDGKMNFGAEEDLLFDGSRRCSLRLKYWRESNSSLRNSSLIEIEEEDSLPNPLVNPRISETRMSIPEEPSVNSLSPFESKQHDEMFHHNEDHLLNIGTELLNKPGVPLPHPDWLKLILDQESLITELQAQIALKTQENSNLKEEINFCKQKLIELKAKLIT